MTGRGVSGVTRSEIAMSDDMLVRLRKIEGQVRGLQHMLERGDTCLEMLTQLAAARAALAAVGGKLVACETRRAVTTAAAGGPAVVEDIGAPVAAAVSLLLTR